MRLEHRGQAPDVYNQVRCPVGLPEVPGKIPVEVAVSIAGQVSGEHHVDDVTRATERGVALRDLKKLMEQY